MIRYTDDKGRHMIFNTATGKKLLQSGRVANKLMTEKKLVKIGNEKTKRKGVFKPQSDKKYIAKIPVYATAYEKNLRYWTVKHFTSLKPVTLSVLTNAILDKLLDNMSSLMVTIRGKDDDDIFIFRTITIENNVTHKQLLNKIIKTTEQKDNGGSDFIGNNIEIDTQFFKLTYKQPPAGASKKTTYTAIKTEYFNAHSYPSKENDCLLAIISDGMHTTTIRKDLQLEGPIKIDDIPIIEKYLKINMNVYYDTVKINKKLFDNDIKNSTVTECEYSYYYKSPNKYNGVLYEILLKDNHYSEIIKFKELVFNPVCGDRLVVTKGITKHLTAQAIRKSLIRQGRKIAGTSKNEYKLKLLFFDVETIFNPKKSYLLEPYSVAWHVGDSTKFDESTISNHMKNTHFLKGENCMKEFVEWIDQNDKDIKYCLIGYNNSRFDNFVLLKEVISNESYNSMLFVQNSILTLNFSNRHSCFDLCRFVMASLKKSCEDFRVYPVKQDGFSHIIPQNAFLQNGWDGLNEWLTLNENKIVTYNKTDVLATESLFYIVREAYEKITTCDILFYTTLASLSYSRFQQINNPDKSKKDCKGKPLFKNPIPKFDISAPENIEDDRYIRNGITGGRCQDFKVKYNKNDNLACVDVKSLYPYVMLNRFYPCGPYKYTKKYREDKLGIYTVRILKQPSIKIIPNRGNSNGDVLDWAFDGEIEKTLTSIELECLKRHGGEFEFLSNEEDFIGIYWKESTEDLFKEFFNPIKDEKTRQDILKDSKSSDYNPALRNITKLLLNSLSGKMVQRNFEDTIELVKSDEQEEKFNNKTDTQSLVLSIGEYKLLKGDLKPDKIYKRANAKPSYLGVFIYAHSRTYMYDLCYSNYECLYTDTDSAFLSWKDWSHFKTKFIKTIGTGVHRYYKLTSKTTDTPAIGGEFGQFEEELNINPDKHICESYILGKKMYCVEIKDKTTGQIQKPSKYRLKGINTEKGRDCLVSQDIVDGISDIDDEDERMTYLYELKNALNDDDNTDKIVVYKQLQQGSVSFLCSGIKKALLNMKQIYSIKTLSIYNDDIEIKDI